MAWNKPSGAPKVAPKKKPSAMRGIVAGAVLVVALAAVCVWMFSGKDDAATAKTDRERGRIKEVTPAAAPTNAAPVRKELTKEEKRLKEIAEIESRYAGTTMPVGVATHLYYLKNPPKISVKHVGPYDVFKHSSERTIASLVLTEPGTEFLDQLQFGARFDQDFVNAMLDKNTPEEGDDEQTINMKKSVDEAKKEISRICREEGRKPSEVMTEYAKMMYDLGKFERNLREMISEKRMDPELSDDEVKEFMQAANKMREERGLPAMKIPSLANRGLMLSHRAARLKAQEAAGGSSVKSDK